MRSLIGGAISIVILATATHAESRAHWLAKQCNALQPIAERMVEVAHTGGNPFSVTDPSGELPPRLLVQLATGASDTTASPVSFGRNARAVCLHRPDLLGGYPDWLTR